MPLRKARPFLQLAALASSVLALGIVAPVASAACVEQPSAKAFEQFGDTTLYSKAPGGDFERGAAGWTLLRALPVLGNDTANVTPGTRSIWMPPLSVAVSPEFCVDETHPTFRYMRMATYDAKLKVILLYRDRAGRTTQAQVESVTETARELGWKPSAVSPLATKIPLIVGGEAASVQLYFVATSGFFWIDSVMVDPYRRG